MQWKRLGSLLTTWLCLPLVAFADGGAPASSVDEREMANAFRSVLMRGDLSDLHDLSARLGLRLHRTRYSWDPGTEAAGRMHAISASVPHFLLANVSYEAYSVRERDFTSAELRFAARVCPDLKKWSREWGLSYEVELLTDAGGLDEVIHGPGATPVSLTIGRRGFCSGSLSQAHPGITTYAPAAGEAHDSGSAIVRKVAAMVLVGDLRDYRKTGRALGDEWIPYGMPRDGLLYDDSAVLSEPVAGIDASLSTYSVQDSGWQRIPGFTWQPRQLAERKATLSLDIDTTHSCIPVTALAAELRRRALPLETLESGGQAFLRGEQNGHRIEIAYRPFGHCVETFYLTQTMQPDVGPLVTFAPGNDVTPDSDDLSPYAIERIAEVVRRLQEASPREIDVAECDKPEATPADKVGAHHLATLVSSALLARGVRPAQIHEVADSAATRNPALAPCSDWGRKDLSLEGVASYVTLRALAE